MVDLIAARIDVYPSEEWSWHALTRLMTTIMRRDQEDANDSAVMKWRFRGPLDTPEDAAAAVADPASAPSTPLLRPSSSNLSDAAGSDSDRGGGGGGSSDSNRSTPIKKSRAAAKLEEPQPPSQQSQKKPRKLAAADDDNESDASTPKFAAQAAPPSPLSQVSGSTGSGALGQRVFAHLQLDSLPRLTERQRQNGIWLGRIEWWVQAPGYWRDVPHAQPDEAPDALPDEPEARLLLLRAMAYWLTLRWMGWIKSS